MPFIQVNMGAGRTPEQKRAMLDGIVEAVHQSLDAPYESIRVWIAELAPEETMIGNESLAEKRARG